MTVLIALVGSMSLKGQTDSFNHVHTMESNGPASVQVLWIDQEVSRSFVEKSIMLQAALNCGTEHYSNDAFQVLCKSYKLQWEVESHNGIHRLGLTFSHLQKERAIELLEEVLQHTAYTSKDWNAWRKKQLYHYEYYKYDSDSLMKWWITGRKDFYETLEELPEPMSGSPLMKVLGRPTIISTVSNSTAAYFGAELSKFISTTNDVTSSKSEPTFTRELKGTSSSAYEGVKIMGVNPVETYILYTQINRENKHVIELSSYNWTTSTGWITFKKRATIEQENISKRPHSTIPFSRETLLPFDLWLEFNKNQALTNAYETLEIWQEPMVPTQENKRCVLIWYVLLPKS